MVEHFTWVLWITGALTATPILQFVAPRLVLKRMYRIELADEAGVMFARHWGLLAAAFGGLLLYAAGHPAVRVPIVLAAAAEKAGLVACIALAFDKPYTKGLRLVAVVDAICVVLYVIWLGLTA